MTASRLRVTLADERREPLERLALRLRRLGHDVTGLARSVQEGIEDIVAADPELAIVVVHDDDRHALDLIEQLGDALDGPLVVFLDRPSAQFLADAADRGISAFFTSPDDEELQGALEVAVRLHGYRTELEARLDTLTCALDRRVVLERAKGVVMGRDAVAEDDAEERLQARARDTGRRLVDVAEETVRAQADGPEHGGGHLAGFAELTLEVSDLDRALGFYQRGLGMEERSRDEDRIWLVAGPRSRLGLWLPGRKEFGDEGGRHVHFAFSAHPGTLDALAARLRDAGEDIQGPVEHPGGDRSVYVRDPDGNVVEVWDHFQRQSGSG